jgi:hypothetical protein
MFSMKLNYRLLSKTNKNSYVLINYFNFKKIFCVNMENISYY